jgi:leucyl-tRNA synthetase
VLFAGPPERDFDWSAEQVEGAFRFLKRVWALAVAHEGVFGAPSAPGPVDGKALEVRRAAHKCLKRVGEAIERLSFNTAIAGIMEFVNALYAAGAAETAAERAAMAEALRVLAVVLTPFVPHLADELAQGMGSPGVLVAEAWPAFDPALVVDDQVTYAVQVNGKLRATIAVAADADEAAIREAALADQNVRKFVADNPVKKVIVVPRKLVSVVV